MSSKKLGMKRLMKEARTMKEKADFENFFALPSDDLYVWNFLIFNLDKEDY